MKKLVIVFAAAVTLALFVGPAFSQDTDGDGVLDTTDNCITTPNGPTLGTCTSGPPKELIGKQTCLNNADCDPDGFCSMDQEDTFPTGGNGIGDACECEGDADCDGDVDGEDVTTFLTGFGRGQYDRPCIPDNPCYSDYKADGDVDGEDLTKFLEDFGRGQYDRPCPSCNRPVGVLFVVHGGTTTVDSGEFLWNAGMQQFSYDPNNSVYKIVIWNPNNWDLGLQSESSLKFIGKYDFEYPRIGSDPFEALTVQQLADMEAELDSNTHGIDFEVDWTGWMCGDCVDHYPYPRFMYLGPDRKADSDPDPGSYPDCRYCGEDEPGGPWAGCDPDRYNVDGPVERLLKKGVHRIIMVDLTVGGVRFSKTFDVTRMVQRMLDDWKTDHGVTVPALWVNDYSDLMGRSFPTDPAGWTRSLQVEPTLDSEVLLNGSPNPVASDADLATLQREAIEASMSGSVTPANTGVILMNHAINDLDEFFDPKMDDTIELNENIKAQLETITGINPLNIVGARMGIKVENTGEAEHTLAERTREMRGESLGHQYLYQTAKVFPSGGSDPFGLYHPWGYLYWDALDYLINERGVQHIVIGFPQITTSSVLDMTEFPNQIGKEIGIKNWIKWGTWDCARYTGPDAGSGICHPFTDYWGNWVLQDCGEWELLFNTGTEEIAAGGTNPVTLVGAAKLVGQTSGATGVIKQVVVESGSWTGGDAAGRIILKDLVGTFSPGETIKDDKGTVKGNALASGTENQTISAECCFEMGGCPDDTFGNPRPYPPPRLAPLPDRRGDMDPSLAYDLSEYGHLGYDPGSGAPDPDNPVQGQYTGTWAMYEPPDDDPRVGELLAKHVINSIVKPMVYLTTGLPNEEKASITEGESVTFEAHVVNGGTPEYSYAWSSNKDNTGWSSVGGNSPTWTWNSTSGDAGTYDVRCVVTDALSETGEVTWENFAVSTP